MSGSDRVDTYVAELGRALGASRRERSRILIEVEDHLRESAAARDVEEALCRFGTVEEVAGRFRVELAAGAAGWTVRLLAVALAAFVGLCAALQSGAVQAASPRSLDAPVGPLTLLALEVSWCVAAITAVRWRRWLGVESIPPEVALAVARGAWVSAAAAFAGGALQVAALATGRAPHGWAYAVVAGGVAIAFAASAVFGAATVTLARARRAGAGDPGDGIADLLVFAERSPLAARLPRRLQARAVLLDPRRHPWRFALAFAVAVGAAFAVSKGMGERDSSAGWAAALGGVQLAAVQAAAVLLAYFTLGRFLGLRPSRRVIELNALRTKRCSGRLTKP